jgi:hypothetical protein
MSLTGLEDAVIRMLLDGDGPTLAQLRRQFEVATVTGRETTGTGFFTALAVPAELRLQFKELQLEGVRATLVGVTHGAGFILFVEDGVLEGLEGYTLTDEPWPNEGAAFTLEYS